jgi:hypothetical protein
MVAEIVSINDKEVIVRPLIRYSYYEKDGNTLPPGIDLVTLNRSYFNKSIEERIRASLEFDKWLYEQFSEL